MTSKDRRFNEMLMSETLCRRDVYEIFERRIILKILDILEFQDDGKTQAFLRKELAVHHLPESYLTHTVDTKTGQEDQVYKVIGYQYVVEGVQLFVVRISCYLRKTIKHLS